MVLMNVATISWFVAQSNGFPRDTLQAVRPTMSRILGWDAEKSAVAVVRMARTQDRPRAECRTRVGGYADDLRVAGRSVEDVERAHCITEL